MTNNDTINTNCNCERCGKETYCEEVPLMGYTEYLCKTCTAEAYRKGDAI